MAASSFPPWVMFEVYSTREVQGCSSSIGDTKTRASCVTTTGIPIDVSLNLAAPPEGSRPCVQLPAGVTASYCIILAAHRDSVLVQVASINGRRWGGGSTTEHFIYNAGNAAADPPRPPSLSLLPLYEGEGRRYLSPEATGLLHRGDDEFVVAELDMQTPKVPELRLLRSAGCGGWSVMQPPVSRCDGGGGKLPSSWSNETVISFGNRMCWVDLCRGLMFVDVFDENPGMQYVPLPEDPWFGRTSYRNVCATAGGDAIKFINIFPRCCCGSPGRSYCDYSDDHAYTVHSWTLRMHDMAWVMDGTVDATQIWSLDGYKGLPRIELEYPVVSMDEPHVIYFMVCEEFHVKYGDDTVFVIMVDMRSMKLRSVFRYPRKYLGRTQLLPSRVSEYFNSKPTVPDLENNITDDVARAACKSPNAPIQATSLVKILAALKEIPGLDRGDMLKAFHILRTSFGSPNEFKSDGDQGQ